jgi:type IV secretory pathway VirD2 relaxase
MIDKYIWLGRKYGLNFSDPEEAREAVISEFNKEACFVLEMQAKVAQAAIQSVSRKYKGLTDSNTKKIKTLVDDIDRANK